ncbi:MAG TPA: hypothetical protein VKZ58_02055 [Longimicrobiales bacterium]|nr:hypothetical protein [Longimicrobiales bacterium]
MRLLLFGLAGFVLGLSGGTVAGLFAAPRAGVEVVEAAGAGETPEAEPGMGLPQFPLEPVGPGELLADLLAGSGAQDSLPTDGSDAVAIVAEELPGQEAGSAPDTAGAGGAAALLADAGNDAPAAVEEGDVAPAAPGSPEGTRRLAAIFRSMKPADAARVLERLEIREIEAILAQLPGRQAAAILSQFDPERAADVTRTLFATGGRP